MLHVSEDFKKSIFVFNAPDVLVSVPRATKVITKSNGKVKYKVGQMVLLCHLHLPLTLIQLFSRSAKTHFYINEFEKQVNREIGDGQMGKCFVWICQ